MSTQHFNQIRVFSVLQFISDSIEYVSYSDLQRIVNDLKIRQINLPDSYAGALS